MLVNAGVVPAELLSGSDIKTIWGDVTCAALDDSQYTITLENLDPQACRSIANLSTTSWASVKVGENEIYSRSTNDTVNPSTLLSACQGATNTVVFTGP